jgi:hypothetical protein
MSPAAPVTRIVIDRDSKTNRRRHQVREKKSQEIAGASKITEWLE